MMRTSQSTQSSAEICRQQGWLVGTLLRGETIERDEHGNHSASVHTIRLTAIGRRLVLVELVAIGSLRVGSLEEFAIDLHGRDWEQVI